MQESFVSLDPETWTARINYYKITSTIIITLGQIGLGLAYLILYHGQLPSNLMCYLISGIMIAIGAFNHQFQTGAISFLNTLLYRTIVDILVGFGIIALGAWAKDYYEGKHPTFQDNLNICTVLIACTAWIHAHINVLTILRIDPTGAAARPYDSDNGMVTRKRIVNLGTKLSILLLVTYGVIYCLFALRNSFYRGIAAVYLFSIITLSFYNWFVHSGLAQNPMNYAFIRSYITGAVLNGLSMIIIVYTCIYGTGLQETIYIIVSVVCALFFTITALEFSYYQSYENERNSDIIPSYYPEWMGTLNTATTTINIILIIGTIFVGAGYLDLNLRNESRWVVGSILAFGYYIGSLIVYGVFSYSLFHLARAQYPFLWKAVYNAVIWATLLLVNNAQSKGTQDIIPEGDNKAENTLILLNNSSFKFRISGVIAISIFLLVLIITYVILHKFCASKVPAIQTEITIVESKKTEIEIPKKVEVEEIKKEEPVEKKLDIDLKEVDLEENNSTSAQSTS